MAPIWLFLLEENNLLNSDSTKETTTAAAVLLLLVLSGQGIGQRSKTESGQDLLDTETAEQTVDKTTQAKTAQQLTNKSQDTVEQQADGGQNLEEWLAQESPEWVELLLGVRHALELLLGIVDALGDGAGQLLEVVSQVILLRSGLTAGCLVLGVGLNTSIRVESTNAAVGLGKDLATLLDQRPDIPDKSFLVKLILGSALSLLNFLRGGTYAADHGADGLDLLQDALNEHAHLLSELLVLLGLLLLGLVLRGLFLNRLRRDVLEQRNVTNCSALAVDDVSIVINLLARADAEVTAGELANEVSVCIDDVTFLVDTTARQRVLLLLDLGLLVAFSVAKNVSVLVAHITILVDAATGQGLAITLCQATDNIAARGDDHTILADGEALKLGEGALLGTLTFALSHNLGAADNVTALAEDVALLVAHATDHALGITLYDAAEDGAAAIDNVAGLVDTLASKDGTVNLGFRLSLGLRLGLPAFSLADNVSAAVKDVTIGVNLHAAELLDVALDDLADLLFVEDNHTLGVDSSVGESLERARLLGHGLKLILGDRLGPTNYLATVVPDGTLLIGPLADEMGHNALLDTADDLAVAVDDIATLLLLTGLGSLAELLFASFGSLVELLLAVLGGIIKLVLSALLCFFELLTSLVELLLAGFRSLTELLLTGFSSLADLLLAGFRSLTELLLTGFSGLADLLLASFSSLAKLLFSSLGGLAELHLASGLTGLASDQTCGLTDLASGLADFASALLGNVADLACRLLSGLGDRLSGITKLTGDFAERALVLVQSCERVVAASVLGGLLNSLSAGFAHGLGLNLIEVVLVHVDTTVTIALRVDLAFDVAIDSATRVDGILGRQLLGGYLVVVISRQILLGLISDL
ncbi:hypothetical protein PgNI_05932 [Pyricularia grisea]|uniref:Uncharacterized protein n=1 Tax=Pyricularia grisea TaxID=148305 RepID=A0A6P8B519_PYRGI|nr:hypothetical protein PgNI_05932 [Pyricularia grisea]TLD10436.1 hypothetical protein PgNI_05932 [Pyricularia grisea]